MTADRQYVFATGCARSGTTALARLLNLHPDVCVGYERYSKLALAGKLEPGLFEPDRFRDFREEDCFAQRYAEGTFRAEVFSKIDTAKVVGDKFPRLVENIDQLDAFPNVKLIFIIREPLGVAHSFEARAKNPNDSWESDRGAIASIAQFNQALNAMTDVIQAGRFDYLIVNHNNLFDDPAEHRRLFSFLGVDPEKLGDVSGIVEQAKQKKRESTDSEIMEHILMHAHVGKFRTVIDAERRQRAAFGS